MEKHIEHQRVLERVKTWRLDRVAVMDEIR
ncbi:hypothetical protein PthstB1num2_30360 [Parageobacillus thermoglucosidasius]|nr:hypothetical protein PTHTG4_16780 [Parageobacillus thermoglucosidasius]GMO00996.1 hypothetical protein PthstB1num2_30360 [Parageobacillus thermoglucosidasius]